MIFVTAMAIGVAAGLTRSVASIAFAATGIAVVFAVACLVSMSIAFTSLLAAIGGYNLGIMALVAVHLVQIRKPAATR